MSRWRGTYKRGSTRPSRNYEPRLSLASLLPILPPPSQQRRKCIRPWPHHERMANLAAEEAKTTRTTEIGEPIRSDCGGAVGHRGRVPSSLPRFQRAAERPIAILPNILRYPDCLKESFWTSHTFTGHSSATSGTSLRRRQSSEELDDTSSAHLSSQAPLR